MRWAHLAGLAVAMATLPCAIPSRASEPLVPSGLAVTHVLVADDAAAREWFRIADDERADHSKRPSVSWLAQLSGADEADVVALYVVVTGQQPLAGSSLLSTFIQGHHGMLERMRPDMVKALSHATMTTDLLPRVNAEAAKLRGQPKPSEYSQLSAEALKALVAACQNANGRSVFLELSE